MTSIQTKLSDTRRPKLLIRAARSGIQHYRRSRDLKRIAGVPANGTSTQVLDALIYVENTVDQERKTGEASYNIRKHISILTALLAEANTNVKKPMAA